MIVWGVTGNNHDDSLAEKEWREAGLTDHNDIKLKIISILSKYFENLIAESFIKGE